MPNEPALIVDTVQDLVLNALRDGGIVGEDESPEPATLNRAFKHTNWLLAQWQRKRYLVYRLVDYSFISTGAQNYKVGKGLTVDLNPRPDRIESAFLRLLNTSGNLQPDLPLDVIQSREDYNRIVLKTMGTLPWRIFYDPVWPVGVLYPWPVPQATIYEVHVTFKETLARFAALADKINLPPEYEIALNWNLAKRFRAVWQLPGDSDLNGLARDGLNVIRLANVAVPTLTMPDAVRQRGRAYDYHSDT